MRLRGFVSRPPEQKHTKSKHLRRFGRNSAAGGNWILETDGVDATRLETSAGGSTLTLGMGSSPD